MRNTFCIIIFFLLFSIPAGRAQETMEADTVALRPIAFDGEAYARFKNSKEFDYYVEKPKEQKESKLREWFYRQLRKLFRNNMTDKQLNVVLLAGLIVLALIIAFLVYRFKPALFFRNKKLGLDYVVEEGEEGADPNRKIKQALDAGDYSEAIRWNYRRLLKILHEKHIISYDPNKTVNEYVYEIENAERRKLFRRLSAEFVFYRYGNGVADRNIYDSFDSKGEALIKQLR